MQQMEFTGENSKVLSQLLCLLVDFKCIVVCYDSKCSTWLTYKFNNVYISSWASTLYKSVFKSEFYQKLVA
jgi:hypothetical protein